MSDRTAPAATPARRLGSLVAAGTSVLLGLVLSADPAAAQSALDKGACADAFEASQTHRRDGRLKASRKAALTCSQEACSKAIRDECSRWLPELDAMIPSMIVAAKDAHGSDVGSARLFVDDDLVADRLDGKPIELDPGKYELRIEPAEGTPATQSIILTQGQRGRVVEFRTDVPPSPSSTTHGAASPLP